MDTADGAFMAHAYGWAFSNPARKLYYNITVTTLSVVVALVVGTIQLLQVLSAELSLDSGFWAWLNDVDFSTLGYGIVALFVVTWTLSYGIWRVRRIEERWTSLVPSR
jgi:high-affinity nickel-transport protein